MVSTITIDEIRAAVIAMIAETKGVSVHDLNDDTVLYSEDGAVDSLGLDSLDGLELSLSLEESFGIDLREDVDFRVFHTIGSIVEYASKQASRP
jgi:acyl carrier protein